MDKSKLSLAEKNVMESGMDYRGTFLICRHKIIAKSVRKYVKQKIALNHASHNFDHTQLKSIIATLRKDDKKLELLLHLRKKSLFEKNKFLSYHAKRNMI